MRRPLLQSACERLRAAPAAAHGEHRGRQLDARPRGGALARRPQGRRGARHGGLLRLPLRRGRRRARPPRHAGHLGRGDDATAADAAGRGDHRLRGRRAPADRDPGPGAPRPSLQGLPEPPGGPVRVDPRRPDPRAGEARRRTERPHDRAAGVHGRRDRAAARDRRPGRADDRAREALQRGAAPGRRAGGAGAHLRGGLRVPLPGGVARGDRADDGGRGRRDRRRARPRGREHRVARGPGCRSTRSGSRSAGRAGRSASSSATGTRRSRSRSARCSPRSRTTRPSRSSTAAR